jgi:sugar phosphate isomerase/epimerase
MALNARLSLNAIVTASWSFEQDLALWDELSLKHVGLFHPKLEKYGFDAAIAALRARDMRASCIICPPVSPDLPDSWDASRGAINQALDAAAVLGGCVYTVTGKGRFGAWRENLRAFGELIAPCVDRAGTLGVTLAVEPTPRPQIAFIHTLAAALELGDATGVSVVVDIGNCWQEHKVFDTIRSLGSRIGLFQLSDFLIGSFDNPGGADKLLPGQGELPLDLFVRAALDAGYAGAFDVEMLGPAVPDLDAIRRSVRHASAILDSLIGG